MANYVLLQRVIVGNGGAASISFTNIPQTGYTDLKVVYSARTDRSAISSDIYMQLNGITTATYSFRRLYAVTAPASDSLTNNSSGGFIGVADGATATALTFGNSEVFIPNYTSSNAKSWSADGVQENNAAATLTEIIAGLWSGTAAITSISIKDYNAANFVQFSTFSLYGLSAVGVTPTVAPKASGGSITTDGTYWYHTFRSSGNFVPQVGLTCDALVVAGGGGGGNGQAGGGGAGGLLGFTAQALTSGTSYTATIGAGGAGSPYSATSGGITAATNGLNSLFSTLTSTGGGSGGSANTGLFNGSSGGSGGGGAGSGGGGGSGGLASPSGQGNAGGLGSGTASNYGGAGGGGALTVGAAGSGTNGGNGGSGSSAYSSWLSATNVGVSNYLAGGGAGATYNGGTGGTGGAGGGGNAGVSNGGASTAGIAAVANTGSGGGGGPAGSAGLYYPGGGNGGSGVVIIRYLVA